MKSVSLRRSTSDFNDLRVVDAPVPEPRAGEVRVRMLLSPVNPSDLNYVHGTYRSALERIIWNHGAGNEGAVYYDPGHSSPCPEPPYSLGGEGVGIVDAAGPGWLARRLVDKRVAVAAGPPNGAWQEYTVVPARKAVVLDKRISDEQGAMFFINPVTAYVITREVLKVPRGEWLLVTAAGSALGKHVVRLGRVFGFRTLCVVRSGANSEELKQLGADAIVETDSQDLLQEVFSLTGGRGVSCAMDCVGGELTGQVVRCLGLDGRLVVYGTLVNDPLQMPIRDLMMPVAQISGFLLPNWMARQSIPSLLRVMRAVKRLTREGVFNAPVDATYPLERISEALTASVQKGRTGKIMLRISEE